jgi:ketosteroid isomerase-like protein
MSLVDELAEIERRRLRTLVEVKPDEADALHADDFRIVTPSGHVWSKAEYLGGIASGEIDYRRFEAISDIDVMADGDLAVLRYRSAIEISVKWREPGELEAWHLDCYRRDDGGVWRIRWSQATSIT